jgi:hypothetical protein
MRKATSASGLGALGFAVVFAVATPVAARDDGWIVIGAASYDSSAGVNYSTRDRRDFRRMRERSDTTAGFGITLPFSGGGYGRPYWGRSNYWNIGGRN